MIIAIDGPAGSGKSTVAKEVAMRLGFHYLDTGAMFRAIAYRAVSTGVSLDDELGLTRIAEQDCIEFGYVDGDVLPSRVFIAGQEVTSEIRTPEIDKAVSPVASCPAVRTALLAQQRHIAQSANYVVEGRDIGSVVFPDAEVKVFVTATPDERARRRAEQNVARGMEGDFDTIYAAIIARDEYDSNREVAPLRPADDSHILDTTELSIDEVVNRIVKLAQQ